MPFKSPTNPQEYWDVINQNWKGIRHIIDLYLPTFQSNWIDGSKLEISLGEYLEELRTNKHPRLVRVMNAALWNIPDDKGVWDYPVLNILQDLIYNECYLYEEKEV